MVVFECAGDDGAIGGAILDVVHHKALYMPLTKLHHKALYMPLTKLHLRVLP